MPTIYLTASIPNTFLTTFKSTKIKKLTKEQFVNFVSEIDQYQDYDNNLAPLKLKKQIVTSLGHENVCSILSNILDNGATLSNKSIAPRFEVNRRQIALDKSDQVLAFIFIPPRRLAEGETWTESDFNSMQIEFINLSSAEAEELDHEWRYKMTKYA